MKIVLVYQYFGTPEGSWSTRIYELTRRWVKRGHDVTVITSPYPKSDISTNRFIDHQEIEGVKLIIINSGDDNKKSVFIRVLRAALFTLVATALSLFKKCNVILCSSGPITVGAVGLIKKFFNPQVKFVFEIRDLWPDGAIEMGIIKNNLLIKWAYTLERLCYRKADLLVTASKGQSESIVSRFPDIKPLTIPNACDFNLFEGKVDNYKFPNWVDNKFIIIHAGSIGLMNNCQVLIEAAKILNKNFSSLNLEIVFIGDGVEKDILQKKVKNERINFVRFIGLIPKHEIVHWFNRADASMLITSGHKVMDTLSPNKIYDTFASKTLLIQTTNGWIKELVSEYSCGINCQNTGGSIASAIEQVYFNSENYREAGNNGYRMARKLFERDTLSNIYIKNLENLAAI